MRKWCGRFHLWVYFATVWWGANLTRSRWLMKCHSQLCGTGDPREDTLAGNSSCVPFSHVLHAICGMGWWHCERWAAHHSLGLSLTLPIRYLMYSVYSWLLQGQEISCHRILIEFGFFARFVENAVHKKGSMAAHLLLPVGARQEVRTPTEKHENINRGKLAHIFIN